MDKHPLQKVKTNTLHVHHTNVSGDIVAISWVGTELKRRFAKPTQSSLHRIEALQFGERYRGGIGLSFEMVHAFIRRETVFLYGERIDEETGEIHLYRTDIPEVEYPCSTMVVTNRGRFVVTLFPDHWSHYKVDAWFRKLGW